MKDLLENKTIIVTGAAGGIGKAAALVLAGHGANVVVTDISETGQDVASEITAAGGSAAFVHADVTEDESAGELVAKALETFGRLDGAFNNAGIEQQSKPLHELSPAEWDRAIRVNLTGIFNCLRHEVKAMLDSGGGAIVNTASAMGSVAVANAAEYVATKHGVIGLSRAAAVDYGTQGIRVNAVLPGVIETPMFTRFANDPAYAGFIDQLRGQHPIGRFGRPEEIGQVVSWLLSDLSSFTTGAAIAADGGYLAI
ncbi:SDR family oxidoreductase [Altericroceibacterium spongiae]|uniref:SDR family oxidoreductase n=1 Tax=Altericroceibacterium spongiae TaxID=2320269 RepID=A0A420ER12_9SPHN|nr:SDR family oxidoreductase [Altericroceibacterium spongiae]RKF23101.1 SDR family oxidoreductase [Altericroceibacterium spongiae]